MNASPTQGGPSGLPAPTLARLHSIERHLHAIDRRLDALERTVGLAAPPVEKEIAAPHVPEPPIVAEAVVAEAVVAPGPAPVAGRTVAAEPARAAGAARAVAAPMPEAVEPAAATMAPPTPVSFRDLEARLTGRALAWAGGVAIVLGAIFLLSLAFSRGWITEEMRVGLGLVGGVVALVIAAWCFERRQPMLGHVLSAVGLGVLSLAFYAASSLYGFVAPEVALAGSFVSAIVAATMAVRYDTQVVAAFGLVTVLAAPPILGASGNLVTMGFLGTALVGTTLISLFRSWPWLPRIAFLLAAPQVFWWVFGTPQPGVALGVAVLAAFWALNAVAAAGTELTSTRTTLGWSSAALLVLNALFATAAGLALIWDQAPELAGALLAALGLAHLALAALIFRRRGDGHPFGLLVAAAGVVALVVAVPVEYEGARVALLWTLLAVGLAVPFARRDHHLAAAGALAVGGLAVAHLALVEYPLRAWAIAGTATGHVPFVSEGGAALGGLLVGLLAAGWMIRDARVRAGLVVAGALLVAYALPYELTGMALVAAWLALAIGSLGTQRAIESRLAVPGRARTLAEQPARWLGASAVVAATLAMAYLPAVLLAPATLPWPPLPATPFTDQATLYAAVVIGGLIAAAAVTTETWLRPAALVAATATAAYLVAFEVGATATVVLWCGLAALQAVAIRYDAPGRLAYLATAAGLVGLAGARTLLEIAPPQRLAVTSSGIDPHPFLVSEATLAIGVVGAALAGAAWLVRGTRLAPWLQVAAGVTIVYLLSVGIVDVFAGQVGGSVALEELQRQAQVALSILWAGIGFGTFAVGAVRGLALAREFGLALLAIATVKVFVFDLSFLDVAYRVLSFIGLGLLLLAGAFVFQWHRPKPGGHGRVV